MVTFLLMRWLLIYLAATPNGTGSTMVDVETKALCEQRGIELLKSNSVNGAVFCVNQETGERFEVKTPKD